jgi:ABC-type glycerol-3-phosphate transport system permease component
VKIDQATAVRPSLVPRRSRATRRLGILAINLLIALGGLLIAFPYFYMIVSSFKRQSQIYQIPLTLIPNPATLFDYHQLFNEFSFSRWFLNSAIVALGTTAGALLICSLAGFALAKYSFRGKTLIFLLMIATLTLPFQVLLVPLFKEMVAFGWINTYQALIVPFAANAFGVFLMRQYMLVVPSALLEAARIDGASEWMLYWRIALPLVRPGLAVVAILFFTNSWNDFLWPLVATSSDDMYLLNIGIATMSGAYHIEYGTIMAASVLATLPIAVVFLFMQRQFVAGLAAGALKG